MSALLLPELAREMAGSNRRVAATLEAESHRLEKLRAEEEGSEGLARWARLGARGATAATLSRKVEVLGLWQQTQGVFAEGLNGERALGLLQIVLETIESWLFLARVGRAVWTNVEALGGPVEGTEGLRAAEEEITRAKGQVEKIYAFLTRPRFPVDPALLEKGQEEIARGKYKIVDQIRSARGPAEGEKE